MGLITCYTFDKAVKNMPGNVDQYIMVYDIMDSGMANFNMSHIKQIIPVINVRRYFINHFLE